MKSLSTVKQIVAQLDGEFLLAKKIKLPQPEQTQVYQYLTGEPPPIFPHTPLLQTLHPNSGSMMKVYVCSMFLTTQPLTNFFAVKPGNPECVIF